MDQTYQTEGFTFTLQIRMLFPCISFKTVDPLAVGHWLLPGPRCDCEHYNLQMRR